MGKIMEAIFCVAFYIPVVLWSEISPMIGMLMMPKTWCKSISAFANGRGGKLIFGIADDDTVI